MPPWWKRVSVPGWWGPHLHSLPQLYQWYSSSMVAKTAVYITRSSTGRQRDPTEVAAAKGVSSSTPLITRPMQPRR